MEGSGQFAETRDSERNGDERKPRPVGKRRALKESMNIFKCSLVAGILTICYTFAGCSGSPTKSADISDSLRHSLDNAGLKDVTVSQDRDKGVVTLGGHVPADSEKSQAESLAAGLAMGQVVANQIAVIPVGIESDAKKVNADLDDAIGKNLDAALIQNSLQKSVKYAVKSGVVTLTGEVISQSLRTHATEVASSVPNVQQVVNELQVKNQKATSN